ncbi:unnamed protein product [Camellia sinensis]
MSSTLDLIDEAEEAFLMNNFSEAVNLATMAKQRYPSFDYIDKFLKAYSIHSDATNNKLGNGEIDWYAVLGGVDSKSETKDIKKQYQKLALLVHPDKNASLAAEGAFKIVSTAWEVLSETSTRKAYDDRRDLFRRRVDNTTTGTSQPSWWPSSFGTRECPRCREPCFYLSQKRVSIYCFRCERKFAFPSTAAPAPSRVRRCIFCHGVCHYQSTNGYETVTCTQCSFRQSVPTMPGWTPLFGVRFDG